MAEVSEGWYVEICVLNAEWDGEDIRCAVWRMGGGEMGLRERWGSERWTDV